MSNVDLILLQAKRWTVGNAGFDGIHQGEGGRFHFFALAKEPARQQHHAGHKHSGTVLPPPLKSLSRP